VLWILASELNEELRAIRLGVIFTPNSNQINQLDEWDQQDKWIKLNKRNGKNEWDEQV